MMVVLTIVWCPLLSLIGGVYVSCQMLSRMSKEETAPDVLPSYDLFAEFGMYVLLTVISYILVVLQFIRLFADK